MSQDTERRLTREEFVRVAILRLRDLSKSKGIHAVYSGFNNAFREYFGEDPVEFVRDLAKQGKVEIAPRRGGVMIYLPGEAPKSASTLGKRPASRQEKNINALYKQWWKNFDEVGEYQAKFWKEKERQGRLYRSRLDLFFFHYLTYRISHEIKMGHLYQEFKDWWSDSGKRSIEAELEVVNRSSSDFRSFLEADDTNRLGVLAQ